MGDNTSAHAELTKQIALLRALPARLQAQAPPLVAKILDAGIRANIAAGTAPDGTPWQRTATGAVPLRNAGKALTVRTLGTTVLAKLVGPEALHHRGAVAGKIRRQILPTKRVPDSMTRAIKRALSRLYKQIVSTDGR